MNKYLLVLLIFYGNLCVAQVFVNKEANGSNDGTSWADAYTDLDAAINATSNGEIWVAAGVYKPSSNLNGTIPNDEREKTFLLKNNIAIYGGFSGNENLINERNWENNQTILSGDIGVEGDSSDNSYHVVSAEFGSLNQSTILDGLTIRDGYASNSKRGAGIFVQTSGSFILRNCQIENNYSYREGGGLYVSNSDPLIENNLFRNNQAFSGGGIYLYYSDAVIQENEIINNKAENYPNAQSTSLSGGGIHISAYSSPIIRKNEISGNLAGEVGGGISNDTNYEILVEGNYIINNKSQKDGGGIYNDGDSYLFNNVIANNEADMGGAVFCDEPYSAIAVNNTVVYNKSNSGAGGFHVFRSHLSIANTLLYGNENEEIKMVSTNHSASLSVNNCNVEGLGGGISSDIEYVFEGNISVAPELDEAQYETQPISDLIDSGTLDNALIGSPWTGSNGANIDFPNTDILGLNRIYNNKIDIGAYEVQSQKQYQPSDLLLSGYQVDQAADVGTLIGTLSTIDQDSEEFVYELLEGPDCFSISESNLITSCLLVDQTENPVQIVIKSTDDNGWNIERTFEIEILNITLGGSIDRYTNILIFPNPTNDLIQFSGLPLSAVDITVSTLDGRLISSFTNCPSINLGNLENGIYLLSITTKTGVVTKRILVQD